MKRLISALVGAVGYALMLVGVFAVGVYFWDNVAMTLGGLKPDVLFHSLSTFMFLIFFAVVNCVIIIVTVAIALLFVLLFFEIGTDKNSTAQRNQGREVKRCVP